MLAETFMFAFCHRTKPDTLLTMRTMSTGWTIGIRRWMQSRATQTLALMAICAAMNGCIKPRLCEESAGPLVRLDERVVKGIGMTLFAAQPLALGRQRIVVDLAIGSRLEMSNLSALWLTYSPPGSSDQHTVRMLPAGDYRDAFCAVVPFTEAGLWDVNIKVYRVGSVPAASTFNILCCDDGHSGQVATESVEER